MVIWYGMVMCWDIVKEEERLFAKVQKQTVHLALCLDTVGQNRRFTDDQVHTCHFTPH
jgi:hypothetical protein